jgi:CheY-like chemotaxis protein
MKLLLIEDNQANADLYRTSLQRCLNAAIVHVLTGTEGIRAARHQNDFEVILIDFDLPDLHGTQVGLALLHLMRRGYLSPAALVALTAQSDKHTRDEAEQLGFAAFLCKPVIEGDLIGVIRELQEKR